MSRLAESWGRNVRAELAIEKILDGAERAFAQIGVSAAGMAEIAEYAGCSRRTLYRYFPNRHDLHLAYVNRAAARILQAVYANTIKLKNPRDRLTQSMLIAIREVRRNPGTAAWFAPGVAELAARMSRASDILQCLTGIFAFELPGAPPRDKNLPTRWLIRIIVSFLAMPAANEAEERAMIERFVAPAVVPIGASLRV